MKRLLSKLLVLGFIYLVFSSKASAEMIFERAWGNDEDDQNLFRTPVALAKDEVETFTWRIWVIIEL